MTSKLNHPLLTITLAPMRRVDHARLGWALDTIAAAEEQVWVTSRGEEYVVAGITATQLQSVCDRIERDFSILLLRGPLRVQYRETVRKTAEAHGKFIRTAGERHHYAHVKLRVEPNAQGGFEYANQVTGGAVPERFFPAVERGVTQALAGGVVAGYPLMDLKVVFLGGSYHEQDSSEISFESAAVNAFKEAARKASPILLEPVMAVEVTTEETFLGTVLREFEMRRGRVQEMSQAAGVTTVKVDLPLAEILNYATELREATDGKATHTSTFSHYEPAPPGVEPDEDASDISDRPRRPGGLPGKSGPAATKADLES